MDNRIPKPLRDHLEEGQREAQRADADSFLAFADWLANRGNAKTQGWITVAETDEREEEHRLTTSYLIPSDQVGKGIADERFDGFHLEDGSRSAINAYLGRDQDEYAHDSPLAPGAKPFVLHRYHHGYVPNHFEIVQAFELFWNAWRDGDVLRRIDKDGQVHDVARLWSAGKKQGVVEVDAHHLKAFLTENDCVLTRLHAHRRFSGKTVETEVDEFLRDDTGIFNINASNVSDTSQYAAQGNLFGRDFVLPYREQTKIRCEPEERFQTFAVGRNDQGKLREVSCDPDAASSYFRDTGNEHFLTPVFFRSGVLRRYYDDPRRFTIERGYLQCLDLWSIPYERSERTSNDVIQVYLGDLGSLPYAEQRHWRVYNEVVEGGISLDRFARDFMVQWTAPPPDPAFDLLHAIESVNATSQQALGGVLFRQLSPSDEHVRTGLRVPLEESAEEADSQLTAAAKLLVESLDTDLLRKNVPKGTNVKEMKGLKLLETVLTGLTSPELAETVMRPLYNIYYLRSTGSAHYRGSEWEKTLERSGLAGLSYRDMIREAFRQAAHTLSDIQATLAAHVRTQ